MTDEIRRDLPMASDEADEAIEEICRRIEESTEENRRANAMLDWIQGLEQPCDETPVGVTGLLLALSDHVKSLSERVASLERDIYRVSTESHPDFKVW